MLATRFGQHWWKWPTNSDGQSCGVDLEKPNILAQETLRPLDDEPRQSTCSNVEHIGSAMQLRPFANFDELDAELKMLLHADLAEANFRMANRDVWHEIGRVQKIAIADVLAIISVIPRDTAHNIWQQTLHQRLLMLLERFNETPEEIEDTYYHIDEEQMAYYASTLQKFLRAIAAA